MSALLQHVVFVIAMFGLVLSLGTAVATMGQLNSSSKYVLFYSLGVFGYACLTLIRLYLLFFHQMDQFVCEYLNRIAPMFVAICLIGNVTLVSFKTKILRSMDASNNSLLAFTKGKRLDDIVVCSLYGVCFLAVALLVSPYTYNHENKNCVSKYVSLVVVYIIIVTIGTNCTYLYLIIQHLVVFRKQRQVLASDASQTATSAKLDRFYNFSCACMILSLLISPACWVIVAIYSKKPGPGNYLITVMMAMTENFGNFALMVLSVKINAVYSFFKPDGDRNVKRAEAVTNVSSQGGHDGISSEGGSTSAIE